jgi:hypothetical protein
MYIEPKGGGLDGEGRIGWVEVSRTMRSYVYQGRRFLKTRSGYKYNCLAEDTGEPCWITGPKKRGGDHLYGRPVAIDEDAREAYWTTIRNRPDAIHLSEAR